VRKKQKASLAVPDSSPFGFDTLSSGKSDLF
jgi:hypothetical protein